MMGSSGAMRRRMRQLSLATALWIFVAAGSSATESISSNLPTGQALTPSAVPGSRFTPLVARVGPHPSYIADGAAAIAVSPDKREMLVLTSGFNRYKGTAGKVLERQSTQYVSRYAIYGRGTR